MTNSEKPQLQIGSIVFSKMGRDAGKYYIIVKLDEQFCYIADGSLRKLKNPKKKNIKHVKNSGCILEQIAEKFIGGKKVFDTELNRALREFNQSEDNNV